ncbi:MAG: anti-sigma factor [Cyclobacteriaceae bacterium]
MNTEEYISSGILESYVLDQLSQAERMEVEEMAQGHEEVRKEIERIERSIEALAFGTAVTPPADVKDKLASELNLEETPVVSISGNGSASPFLKYAAAASVLIALGSATMAFNYWSKWKSAEGRLSDLVAQNQQFADNYNTVNQQLNDVQDAVAIMNNSAFSRVVMNGTDNSPGSLATIYWNKSTQDVYLNIQELKELSQNQQYQLWAIIDGKPIDAGVFDSGSSRLLVQMKSIGSGAAAFAVTIEPRGGSESPSLETMQVVGNV